MSERRTPCTWFLPAGIRSAIDAEASRRSTTPSRVVEALLLRYLPEFVAESIAGDLRRAEAPGRSEVGAT